MIEVACAVVFDTTGQVMIAQRSKNRDIGLWEFPGGKKSNTESILDAVVRELKEELNILVEADGVLMCLIADPFVLHFVKCRIINSDFIELQEHNKISFVPPVQLDRFDLTNNDKRFAEWLIRNPLNHRALGATFDSLT